METETVGAIRTGGNWVRLLAIPSGALMDGLFPMPKTLLAPTIKNAKSVQWIYVGDEEEVVVEKAPAKKGAKGSTVVVDDEKKEIFKGMPHVIRVELNEKVSIKQFISVQNSGCMSGG